MKRTHSEQIEYFEHDGNRYRRFADGVWQVQVSNGGWSEYFCDSNQLEAIYRQPDLCKSCKYYDSNKYLHCAVHPNGPDGVCGDWDEKTVKERPTENNYYYHLVRQLNDGSRDLHTALPRRRDRGEDRTISISYFEDGELVGQRLIEPHRASRSLLSEEEWNYSRYGINEAELAFLQSCDRFIVRPEHIGVVFYEDQPLLVGDIIYFNSSQSAIAIERNGQLVWRSSGCDLV